jgi:hypothetical protein
MLPVLYKKKIEKEKNFEEYWRDRSYLQYNDAGLRQPAEEKYNIYPQPRFITQWGKEQKAR